MYSDVCGCSLVGRLCVDVSWVGIVAGGEENVQ